MGRLCRKRFTILCFVLVALSLILWKEISGNSFLKETEKSLFDKLKEFSTNQDTRSVNTDDIDDEWYPGRPGEMGDAVIINVSSLTRDQKDRYDRGWKNHAFNEYVSDMISLDRTLKDSRLPECKTMVYNDLPDASVIMTFHNEAWSVLLRSVHSVLNQTPPHLLKELILVDDFSDQPHLHLPLNNYLRRFKKVTLLRTNRREGLIRARLLGYYSAKGTVLVFLDSHIECTEGWIEPLLERIHENHTIVVTPTIDIIDSRNFKYTFTRSTRVGGFDWLLFFQWRSLSSSGTHKTKAYLPVKSPTMAGGLFTISRDFFTHIGTYDAGMNVWGAENLEISFRIWMCGGSLETLPCSHVGHVFRDHSPYTWSGGNSILHNNLRLAEVWLDEFKVYYFKRLGKLKDVDYGDVTERKKLRKRLNCQSFSWYLKNIFPDLYNPTESSAWGEIRSQERPVCIDGVDKYKMNAIVEVSQCHQNGGNQFWLFTNDKYLRRDKLCMEYTSTQKHIQLFYCDGDDRGPQHWDYTQNNTLYHPQTNKCVTLSDNGKSVTMETCRSMDRQIWMMDRNPPHS